MASRFRFRNWTCMSNRCRRDDETGGHKPLCMQEHVKELFKNKCNTLEHFEVYKFQKHVHVVLDNADVSRCAKGMMHGSLINC